MPDHDPLVYYRAMAAFAVRHLIKPGMLLVEINERFGRDMMEMLTGYGFSNVLIIPDLNGKDRFAEAILK